MTNRKSAPKKYWFKRKRYGYGLVPATWQGWAVLVVYVESLIILSLLLLDNEEVSSANLASFFLILSASMLIVLAVSLSKGPAPKWRWGKKPGDDPNEDW